MECSITANGWRCVPLARFKQNIIKLQMRIIETNTNLKDATQVGYNAC